MKKLFCLLLLGISLVTACTKDLHQVPISSATTASYYKTSADFVQGINAIYSALRAYPDRLLNLSETRSDNLYAVVNQGVRNGAPINRFEKTIASHNSISEAWNTNFSGIFRANQLLDQLQKNTDVVIEAGLKIRLEAEAKFLRAFYYFDMVRWFGKLPVIDHPVTADEALNMQRSAVSDVYKLILSDLQFAVANLPDVYPAADKGRITKYAAEGILALVYMTRSGPTYGIEGPGLGLNEWSLALSLLQNIISDNKFSFINSYSSIFSYTNENNSEAVLNIAYASGATPVLGSTFPWLLVPDDYFLSLGKVPQGGLGIRPVSKNLLNDYESGDIRKPFSIFLNGYTYNGVQETQSFFKKYLDITKVPTTSASDWPIDFIALRYTDVLMMKAECILHGAPGQQSDVDAIVTQVRQRAGLAPKTNITLPQLLDERRKEFAAEGLRWHDLVRSGLVESVMVAYIASEDVQHQVQPFQKNYIIYPIPQAEIDVKQGLYTQNPGY